MPQDTVLGKRRRSTSKKALEMQKPATSLADLHCVGCLLHDNQIRGRNKYIYELFNVIRQTADYYKDKMQALQEDNPNLYGGLLLAARKRLNELEDRLVSESTPSKKKGGELCQTIAGQKIVKECNSISSSATLRCDC